MLLVLRWFIEPRSKLRAPRGSRNVIPHGGVFAVEAQGQALGTAAGFQKLIQFHGQRGIAPRLQLAAQLRAAAVDDHRLAHDDGVAGETYCLVRLHGQKSGNMALDHSTAIGVEGAWEIDGLPRSERAEARIEMIEARIDQFERQYQALQHFAQVLVSGNITANAVAGKENRPAKEGVASAFEIEIFRQVLHAEAVLRKPGFEEGRFTCTHVVPKTRAEKPILEYQSGIGGKDEVRQ